MTNAPTPPEAAGEKTIDWSDPTRYEIVNANNGHTEQIVAWSPLLRAGFRAVFVNDKGHVDEFGCYLRPDGVFVRERNYEYEPDTRYSLRPRVSPVAGGEGVKPVGDLGVGDICSFYFDTTYRVEKIEGISPDDGIASLSKWDDGEWVSGHCMTYANRAGFKRKTAAELAATTIPLSDILEPLRSEVEAIRGKGASDAPAVYLCDACFDELRDDGWQGTFVGAGLANAICNQCERRTVLHRYSCWPEEIVRLAARCEAIRREREAAAGSRAVTMSREMMAAGQAASDAAPATPTEDDNPTLATVQKVFVKHGMLGQMSNLGIDRYIVKALRESRGVADAIREEAEACFAECVQFSDTNSRKAEVAAFLGRSFKRLSERIEAVIPGDD